MAFFCLLFSPAPGVLCPNAVARRVERCPEYVREGLQTLRAMQHDITESKCMLETVEQIFERGSTPMVMVFGRQRMFVHFLIIYWQSC
jgi:hypothetical protein